jgi:multiple sugar transport system permease protein
MNTAWRIGPTQLAMIAPVQLLLGLVILVPALWVIWLSFHESSFGLAPRYVGLANYARLLAEPAFWRAVVNTVVVVLIVVHVELALGLALALLFADGAPFRRVMIGVVLAPYAISEVSAVVMWRTMMDPEVGVVSRFLSGLGLPALEWAVDPWAGLSMVALLSVWLHLPFTFIILYAARLAVPGELYEAARIDGATAWQRFVNVTIPVMMPAILVALLFRYIFAFRIFSEVWLLTGGGPARQTEVMAVYLYLEAFRYNEFGVAAATGWLMVLASILLGAVYLHRIYTRMFREDAA